MRPRASSTPATTQPTSASPSFSPIASRSAPIVSPFRARRTLHLRFNDLKDPASIPRDTDFSSVFESDVPVIVQHTRLDSRHPEVSLMSTTAYADG